MWLKAQLPVGLPCDGPVAIGDVLMNLISAVPPLFAMNCTLKVSQWTDYAR